MFKNNYKQYLVTTAEEETWPKKGEILFLGEWCKLYNKKEVWGNLVYKDFPYHWDDRRKLDSDVKYLNEFYERLLNVLALKLNKIHNTDYSLEYWRILIGWWLIITLNVLFDRWELIRLVSLKVKGLKTIIYNDELSNHIPQDINEFKQLVNDDYWNSLIFGSILNYFEDIKIKSINRKKDFSINRSKPIKKKKFKTFFFEIFQKISCLFSKENSPFIINTYMPYLQETILNLSFFRLPMFFNFNEFKEVEPNNYSRDWKLNLETNNKFESFVSETIFDLIPTNFIEGYSKLNFFVRNLNWPIKPKFIFTSNSFFDDDIFKLYLASKKESHTKIITGQHGGHYGIGKFGCYEDYQLSISDIFLSWGWKDGKKNVHPLGILNKTKINNNSSIKKKILIVTYSNPRYGYHLWSAPLASQWLKYFKDQIKFIDCLNELVLNDVSIRLYRNDYGWSQLDRWKNIFPNLHYDTGRLPLTKILPSTRLYVSTYNATTFLESISNNIPTVIFWDPHYWELRDNVKGFFNDLKRVKVFHDTPESAANHINNINNDILSWWGSSEVQLVIKNFSTNYCKKNNSLPKQIFRLIKSELKN